VARILELCILHIAMAEMTSKGTPHKVVINEVLIVCLPIYLFLYILTLHMYHLHVFLYLFLFRILVLVVE
jgi:hypothetical protein